ncbi:hypothetical protein BSPWISOX_3007 [uncultured Gammaproteobacteria bacterium]|nr:hypothetical protein BSPWISOX_3007 [uncultured Gammaproteobacteria bacterium]
MMCWLSLQVQSNAGKVSVAGCLGYDVLVRSRAAYADVG